MENDAVCLTAVTKRFGRRGVVTALDNVTLTLPRGSVLALIGENGAGKSTLLRVIAGTIAPDSGTVERAGAVGFLLGNSFGLYDRLSAREYLRYIGALRGLSRTHLQNRIDAVIDELDIGGFADRRCGGFSAGMRQRTALAACILHEPDLLLLDEPTTGLDIAVRHHVLEAIGRLVTDGRTLIISTHHPEEIRGMADEIAIMGGGRIRYRTHANEAVLRDINEFARLALGEPGRENR